MKNEVYNITKTKLSNQDEVIKNNIDKGLELEREKYDHLLNNYNELKVKIKVKYNN